MGQTKKFREIFLPLENYPPTPRRTTNQTWLQINIATSSMSVIISNRVHLFIYRLSSLYKQQMPRDLKILLFSPWFRFHAWVASTLYPLMANHINDTGFSSSFQTCLPLIITQQFVAGRRSINSSSTSLRSSSDARQFWWLWLRWVVVTGDPAARGRAMPLPPIMSLSPLNDGCDVIDASSLLLSLSAARCPR